MEVCYLLPHFSFPWGDLFLQFSSVLVSFMYASCFHRSIHYLSFLSPVIRLSVLEPLSRLWVVVDVFPVPTNFNFKILGHPLSKSQAFGRDIWKYRDCNGWLHHVSCYTNIRDSCLRIYFIVTIVWKVENMLREGYRFSYLWVPRRGKRLFLTAKFLSVIWGYNRK